MKNVYDMLSESNPPEKHSEFILALEKEDVLPSSIGKLNAKSSLVIKRRKELEQDRNYAQILVYTVFYDSENDTVLAYQRTKQVGETRLSGKKSIGIGGHAELVDFSEAGSLASIIWLATYREFEEELKFGSTPSCWCDWSAKAAMAATPLLMLDCNMTGDLTVEQVHLGIVVAVDVSQIPPEHRPSIQDEALVDLGMVPYSELSNTIDDYECWSQLAIWHFNELVNPTKTETGTVIATAEDHQVLGFDHNVTVYRP